ncbi:MAG TPA: PQQ-dependent sugar dehydrogenase [Candidatus Limnocylindria bacterium]|nr:PQQ-dependent sugar dehydrogenase [Candidatus Limnocylindria bacterium]
MQRGAVLLTLVTLCGAPLGSAAAEDHPVAGDRLSLKDPGSPAKRRVTFRAVRDAAIDPARLGDPTVLGATLEVAGTGVGDGDTGPLALDAGRWKGLGSPPGARGYRYLDRARTSGVERVVLKGGKRGGRLIVTGGGAAWPYVVTQPQSGPIDVRLAIGDHVLCASFTELRGRVGKVKGRRAPPPPDCSSTPPAVCGNGTIEVGEQCDDGGVEDGDGCSALCRIENDMGVCAGVPTTPGTAIRSVLVASGLDKPLYVTAPRFDTARLFIVEQGGTIRIVANGRLRATPFLDLTAQVSCCGERGLLGLAFHPNYAENGWFFVDYTAGDGDTVIARYTVSADPNLADVSSGQVLLRIDQPYSNHNGGQLAFGPDGKLYVGMGDGGLGGDPGERAQSPSSLLGKILRLDVDRAGPPWAAADNPFYDDGATPPLDEIWSFGWRNPWRFSFDRATGDLYVGDVGQDMWEEISFEPSGSPGGLNYGWDVFEGDGHCYEADADCATPEAFVMPVLEYSHDEGCSVTGGYVYRGCAMPDLRGTYFYADYCSGFIRTFSGISGGRAQNRANRTAELAPGGGLAIGSITSFGEDARGELYITDLADGEVFKIVPDG